MAEHLNQERYETTYEKKATPLLLITGFLGSGKTTLINRFLKQFSSLPKAPKLGVVVNEFGQVGIDGALLGPGDIVEMGGGCVCCATGEELWESALSLVEKKGVTHLLVETSGIADPEILIEQYQNLSVSLKEQIDLRGVLCLIDSFHFEKSFTQRKEARTQMHCADCLLFTKVDLLSSAAQLENLHALLDAEKATADRISLDPNCSTGDLFSLFHFVFSRKNRFLSLLPTHNHLKTHDKRQLQAFSFSSPAPFLKVPLQILFQELQGKVLRAKGFVYVAEQEGLKGPYVVHLVGGQIQWSLCSKEQASKAPLETTLVFIGENLDEDWLRLRLSACSL